MDAIFAEEEHDSRFSDIAFLKQSRLPDQVKSLCMLFRVRWWSVHMPQGSCCPKVSLLPAPC